MLLRFATFLSPNLEPLYRATADFVCERIGCSTELTVGTHLDQIWSGEVDFAFVCGYPFVELADSASVHAIAAPVPNDPRCEDHPVYFSDVVVRSDDTVSSFEELRGCHWCFNERSSHSGYLNVLHHLLRMGETPAFFGRFEPVGFHLEAMRLVADGTYEASAIDSHVMAVARRDAPQLAGRLKVIDTIGPSSIQPLVAGDHVPAELREGVREVVTAMHADPRGGEALRSGLVGRFAPVDDSFCADIREMLVAVDRAGFLGA